MVNLLRADYLAKHTKILDKKIEASDAKEEQEARKRIRTFMLDFCAVAEYF